MDKCPNCGAKIHHKNGAGIMFCCSTFVIVTGAIDEGKPCLRRQLAASNERAGRLEKNLRGLCDHLDKWWYEADPMDDVKKGDRHPWTKAAREALEVPDAPLPD